MAVFTVVEALHYDIGKCTARMHPKDMARIGFQDGDSIRVQGDGFVGAFVYTPRFKNDLKEGYIAMDARIRKNGGTTLGADVTVSKFDYGIAREMTLVSISGKDEDVEKIDTSNLFGNLHSLGNIVFLRYEGRPLPLRIVGIHADTDISIVDHDTVITIVPTELDDV